MIPCFTFTPGIHWTLIFFFLCWVSRHFVPLQWANQPRTITKKSLFPLHCPYYHKSDNSLCVCVLLLLLLSRFSCVRLCVTPETAAHQAPPSMGFSRQEYRSGVPLCVCVCPSKFSILFSWLGFLFMDQFPIVLITL